MYLSKVLIFFLIATNYTYPIKSMSSDQNKIQISEDWKKSAEKEFNRNITALQKIIMVAESPEQVTDFLSKFEKQKIWFDKTLQSSKYISDEFYSKIITRNSRLDFMVNLIKKADAILKNVELTEDQKNKIRLKILYEINANPKAISDKNIKNLTISLIEIVGNKKYTETPELSMSKIQFAEKIELLGKEMLDLQVTNKELLSKIDEGKKDIAELRKLISNLKTQTNEAVSKVELAEQLSNSTIEEQSNLFKNKILNIEEQKNKNLLDLEILEKENFSPMIKK